MLKYKKIYKLCSIFENLARSGLVKFAQDLNIKNIELEKLDVNPNTFEFRDLRPIGSIRVSNIELVDELIGFIKNGRIFIVTLNQLNHFLDAEEADEIETVLNNFVGKFRDDVRFDFSSKKNIGKAGFHRIDLDEIFEYLETFDPQTKIIYDEDITDDEEARQKEYSEVKELKRKIRSYLLTAIDPSYFKDRISTITDLAEKLGITVNNYFDKLFYVQIRKNISYFFVDNFEAPVLEDSNSILTLLSTFPNNSKFFLDEVTKTGDEYIFAKFIVDQKNYNINFPNQEELKKIIEVAKYLITDPGTAYKTAQFLTEIKDVDGIVSKSGIINKLQQIVIDRADNDLVYRFAFNIPGANIEKLQEVIIQNRNPEYAYYFARRVPDADIEKLQEIVIEFPRYAYEFAREVDGADIQYIYDNTINPFYKNEIKRLAEERGISLN